MKKKEKLGLFRIDRSITLRYRHVYGSIDSWIER